MHAVVQYVCVLPLGCSTLQSPGVLFTGLPKDVERG